MRKRHILRATRNLVIAAAMAAMLWALEGYDLPTMEMELHRAERRRMTEESDIVWEYEGLMYNDRDMIVGLGPNYISTRTESGHGGFWPRAKEGPTLIGLPERTRYNPPGTAHSYLAPALLAVDVPARAQRARLTMTLRYDQWQENYVIEGEKQGSVWFFQLMMKYTPSGDSDGLSLAEDNAFITFHFTGPEHFYYPCTLELFDIDGACFSTTQFNGGAQAP